MVFKKAARIRRAKKARARIREIGRHRLCIFRSPRHIYAQIISPDGAKILASASTVEKGVRTDLEGAGGNCGAAGRIGELIAERARAVGIEEVAFDRSGFRYHGRVKALADAAREGGLRF